MTCADCRVRLTTDEEGKDDGLCGRCRRYKQDHIGTATADLTTQYPPIRMES